MIPLRGEGSAWQMDLAGWWVLVAIGAHHPYAWRQLFDATVLDREKEEIRRSEGLAARVLSTSPSDPLALSLPQGRTGEIRTLVEETMPAPRRLGMTADSLRAWSILHAAAQTDLARLAAALQAARARVIQRD